MHLRSFIASKRSSWPQRTTTRRCDVCVVFRPSVVSRRPPWYLRSPRLLHARSMAYRSFKRLAVKSWRFEVLTISPALLDPFHTTMAEHRNIPNTLTESASNWRTVTSPSNSWICHVFAMENTQEIPVDVTSCLVTSHSLSLERQGHASVNDHRLPTHPVCPRFQKGTQLLS